MSTAKLSDEEYYKLLAEAKATKQDAKDLSSLTDEQYNTLLRQAKGEDTFVSGFDEETVAQTVTGMLPDVGSMVGGAFGSVLTRSPSGGAMGAALGYGQGKVVQNYLNNEPVVDADLFLGMAKEAALDVSGAKIVGLLQDSYRALTNNPLVDRLNPLKPAEINKLYMKQALQKKLGKYNTGLSLTQVAPESSFIQTLGGASESAVSPSNILREMEDAQVSYLNDEIGKLISISPSLKGKELGVHIQNLIENTRDATDTFHDKMFLDLAEQGKHTTVDLTETMKFVKDVRKKAMEGLKQVEDGEKATSKWLDPKVREFVELVGQLEPTQNFNVAYDKLKTLKKKVAQVKANPENKPILRQLIQIEKSFESSLINGTDNPAIKKMYKDLMSSYSKTMDVTFSTVAEKMFKEEAPEVVAKLLFANNRAVSNFGEFERIVAMSAKYKGKGGKPAIRGLRKGWLTHTMQLGKDPKQAITNLQKALENPDTKAVYNTLMDDKTKKNVKVLMDEFDILSQRSNKELTLVVRGEQATGARQAVQGSGISGKFAGVIRAIIPSKLPAVITDQNRVNGLLKLSALAKRLDYLSSLRSPTRLEKEQLGRLGAHFVSSLDEFNNINNEIENQEASERFAPKLEGIRSSLREPTQYERTLDTIQ